MRYTIQNKINRSHLLYAIHALFLISILQSATFAYAADNISNVNECVQEAILQADSSVTVGELQEQCRKQQDSTAEAEEVSNIQQRLQYEKATWDNPYAITVHKPNYILLAAYNEDTNEAPFQKQFPDEEISLDNIEVKFQISGKFPLVVELFEGKGDLYFAYTNRSFWQLYNPNSAPFRETNHEPEVFLTLTNDWVLGGFTNSLINFALVHQSNGQGGTLSRSWNRIYISFVFEKKNLVIAFKPWYRIPESADEDDNPDIEDYLGNFELFGVYPFGEHTFGALLRNNLDGSDNRGAIQLDWNFPIYEKLYGYVQYFNGYGESLIDYNYHQKSIGIGISLSGWL